MMDDSARETINTFLAQYDTLAIATELDGQPYVTRAFFVEEPVSDAGLKMYGTFITTDQPTAWLEATAQARTLTDESASSVVRENLGKKSPVAATFIARVPIV